MSEANPFAGEHGFSGACCPKPGDSIIYSETFSVGIFKWLRRAHNKGLKKGTVKVRVHGSCQNPEAVYVEARRIIKLLNTGKYNGQKNVKV